jgi:cytochrome P450
VSCPYTPVATAALTGTTPTARAPLSAPLVTVYPGQVLAQHRCVEDPATVREILRRPECFAADNALTTAMPLAPATLRRLAARRFSLPPVLASASGEPHRQVRRIVARFFSPAKVAAQSEPIRALVQRACDGLRAELDAGGTVDLAADLAAVVPPRIMAALTGVATPPQADLKRWSRDSLELFWGWPDAERQLDLSDSATDFHAWLRDEVDRSTATGEAGAGFGPGAPGPNLFAALHAGGVDRERIRSLGYFLVIAGQETTAMLAQTVLVTALAEGRWAQCGDPDGGTAASREVVRRALARASSVPTWRRLVVKDTQVGPERFAAGEHLVLRLSGGALGEAGDPSLAFGFGVHRCLGAGLAELEAALILEEAARALPGLMLAAEPEWEHLLSFQAPRTVPVRSAAVGADT